ncbi:ubiquitin-conjugating enzyme subfamily protein, partial [Cardiosporidium cionae]
KEPSEYWCAYPLSLEDPFEWHFSARGPTKTEFEGGIYHGRIVLPENYPFAPPSIIFLTPNGRFEVGKKSYLTCQYSLVCLSASNYHPELWQPAWGLRIMLGALCAFFSTPGEGAIHSLDWSPEIRKKLAKESTGWTCSTCQKSNEELVAENCSESPPKPAGSSQNISRGSISQTSAGDFNNNYGNTTNEQRADRDGPNRNTSISSETVTVISAEQILSKRRSPQRNSHSLMAHLFRRPTNRQQLFTATIDIMLGIFFVAILRSLT